MISKNILLRPRIIKTIKLVRLKIEIIKYLQLFDNFEISQELSVLKI